MTASHVRGMRAVGVALVVALGIFCVLRLEISSDVTRFVPTGSGAELSALARRLVDSQITHSMVLTIASRDPAPDDEAAKLRVAAALAESLQRHPEVAWVRSGVDEGQMQAFFELYFPHRFDLASPSPEDEVPALLTDEALARRARALRDELTLPSSSLTTRLAGRDPLGLFGRLLDRFGATQPELRMEQGQFVTRDGRWAVLFVGVRSSPFDSTAQRPLIEAIESRFEELAAAEAGGDLVLDMTGVNRFAVATERSIRSDMTTISLVSVIGVCTLFLLFFRSLSVLALAMLPTFVGTLIAVDLGIVVFHPIHGVTLAFGVSLVGIAIDYSIHLLNHHTILPDRGGPWATLRRLLPSLLLGAATTIASFAGLAATRFPAIREIGIFASLGIAFSLLVTLVVLPGLLSEAQRAPAAQRRTAAALGRLVNAMERHRAAVAVIPLAALLVCSVGLPRLRWLDDPAGLTALDPELVAEDARVRSRVSRVDAGRFVIAVAPDPESTLALNDAVHARLSRLVEAGEIGRVRSLHALVWSQELQRRNRAAFRADPELPERLNAVFGEAGFRPGAFDAFGRELRAPETGPLTLTELDASPLGRLAESLFVALPDGDFAAITYLERVRSSEPVARAVADLPGVSFFDQRAFVAELYASFRATALRLIGIGVALVFGVLLLRYRRLGPALAAFFPSVLAAGTEMAILALLGIEANLLSIVSLVLVMGMGVDYGIFVVDSGRDPQHLGATMLSILLSALTTVFVFGTLALSSHPALRAIGLTCGLGVLLAFVFAPTALVLARSRSRGA